MTWAAFYLGCFVVGFALTLISFLAGSVHLHIPTKLHLPGLSHGHAVHSGPAHSSGAHGMHGEVPIINFATVVAFLAWFGAGGYLLTHFYPVHILVGFFVAFLGGLAGASIVFWFLKTLMAHDRSMQSADYDMIGVLGRVNVPIREGGTGEIVFSLAGTRRCSGARSDDGSVIAKGTEVVVTRYEHGIAYVKRWEELAGEEHDQSAGSITTLN
jgi:membrane protein implicated in regulation of membrane protease activity